MRRQLAAWRAAALTPLLLAQLAVAAPVTIRVAGLINYGSVASPWPLAISGRATPVSSLPERSPRSR